MSKESDFLDALKERAASGKPMIVVEPEVASEELVRLLKNTLPDGKKNHVQYINLDGKSGQSTDTET